MNRPVLVTVGALVPVMIVGVLSRDFWMILVMGAAGLPFVRRAARRSTT